MKYLVLLGDGMADKPIPELEGRTPLEAAHTPNMDYLAGSGKLAQVSTVPPDMPPGSDVANLSILGYDPHKYYTGRAPIEAASLGLRLRSQDVAFRCNLVTLGESPDEQVIMQDYSAGHITSLEARKLIAEINVRLGSSTIQFFPGVSYRHIMVWTNGTEKVETTPPHDITGQPVDKYLPHGRGNQTLTELMRDSQDFLKNHPINRKRMKHGKSPANSIWLWGQGRPPDLELFREKYGLEGSLISAVDLLKGLGKIIGFQVIKVPGATGYLDTNYQGKAEAALRELEKRDIVYLHVEAPDEAAHNGNLQDKIKAIEDFDKLVVGTVIKGMEKFGEYRIMVLPDHTTPISTRTHGTDPVPAAIYSSVNPANSGRHFTEKDAADSELKLEQGWELMEYFIKA